MMERLTNADSIKDAEARIRELIGTHGEWLYVHDSSRAVLLRNSECDFRVTQGRLIFSGWNEQGTITWHIIAWEWTGEKLLLEASRRMGAERTRLELIPRASIKASTEAIGDTRRERCYTMARLACTVLHGTKVERAGLSAGVPRNQPGRYARILLQHFNRQRIAVAGTVAESDRHDVDAFLSSTLVWFTRACERARPPYIQKLWLISGKEHIESLAQRLALLRDEVRRVITLYQINDEWQELTPVRVM